jgi:signal transduction histidine kinase
MTALLGDKDWRFSIRDTGMGIPVKSRPHLFEKFYRVNTSGSKVTGTGLGLSICRQIISGHGGSIELESKLGEGTVFNIHMPKGA